MNVKGVFNMGNYQRWVTTNLAGLVATTALVAALAAGLFVTIAQVRCTLLEEDMARLRGRLTEAVETLKAEQEAANKAVVGVMQQTVKHVAARLEEAKDEPPKEEPATDEPSKDEPEKGPE